ncbi:MAG: DEAD/DEAH box helicase family protein [Clostridiales Family XIII bacterium]|nr:DEAD/DEAH box helicase family protein [Clostridiales Family XIII bacterium]
MDDYGTSDIELYRAFYDTDILRGRLLDFVFGSSYQLLAHPERGNTVQHRNFRALTAIAPEIVNGEATYMRLTAGAGFDPLSIDVLSRNRISIAHNYEQNGDLMADPDMEFVIDREAGTLSARTYQQDNRGLYQHTEGEDGEIADARLARELDSFTRQWFSNIQAQKYQKEKMTVISRGEEIEVVYTDGKVSAINGETEAIDAYARKIGIEPPPYDGEETPQSESIRLTRVGDFYEAYGEDARTLAGALTLSLITRDADVMCGFPDRLLDEYAARLAEAGYAAVIEDTPPQTAAVAHVPTDAHFIPEHEDIYIRESLLRGPMTEGGKERVYDFFQDRNLTGSVPASFLSREYGTGGRTMDFSDGVRGHASSSGAGIRIDFGIGNPEIRLSWARTAGLLYNLIQSGEYLPERGKPVSAQMTLFDIPAAAIPAQDKAQSEDETPDPNDLIPIFDEDDDGDGDDAETIGEPLPAPVSTSLPKPPNFVITPDLDVSGGAKAKYRRNVEAIRLLRTVEAEERYATPEEQAALALYSGWGGVSDAFTEGRADWRAEHDELKELLSEHEYRAAADSTLTAHYTSSEVIGGIYAALDRFGFKGGNVLEPSMGVGNFYGCMPEGIAGASRLYGVELDSITGRIAKQLYPNADIRVQGFENADLPDNFFDAAIGNVPFGQYKLNDTKFDKYNFLVHDYFFAKALDRVRPGGVVAFITSKGTMDKANTSVRRYLAERAELLGAIRLPNTAFKSTANTEVTSDIVFLKKRDRLADAENEKWIHTGKTDEGIPLNEYFLDNPHMMLGEMAWDSGRFGDKVLTTLNPDGRDLREALSEAVSFLPEDALDGAADLSELDGESSDEIPADPTVKNFCYAVMEDGGIYQRVNSRMEKREFAKTAAERVTAMIDMRSLTRFILTEQLDGIGDESLAKLQAKLNADYDRFHKRFGALNTRYNISLFGDDADFPLLSSIENLDDGGNVTKAAIFTRRTISRAARIDRVDTSAESLPVCLNERGYVDIGFMASLSGKTHEEVIEDLRGVIFKNPVYDDPDDENNIFAGWETADEYLSGKVKDKLAAAEFAARDNPLYAVNVDALRAVQPKPLEAHEISARIGAHWIDIDYYRRFIIEKLNVPEAAQSGVKIHYARRTGEWAVDAPYGLLNSVEATQTHGTKRMDAYCLFETTLNQRNARIYDTKMVDGKEKRVLNHKETVAIRDRQAKLKQEFKRWVFDDPERREKLCEVYNRLFNSERSRVYDGSHLTFPGMSPEVRLDPHQRNGAARILYGGNTLLAHVVGSGKTYTMTAAAMEMKRLGMARKPCFVVPNHLVGQWASKFQEIYPTANILAATKKDFEKQNRRRFCARIATGEWDAVIIGHSSFEKVPVSRERREERLRRDLDEVEAALIEAKVNSGERVTVKELARTRKTLEYELKRLQSASKDDLVTFEELGVDALFVDEAHYYKNKFFFSKMSNVAGLSKARAKKSGDLDMKCEYINEQNRSPRGVVFATGTPISNSMVELYTMQSYLQREELERLGLNHFDNWAAAFGEVVSALELAPSGRGFRVRERFAKFVNLPELMTLFHLVADIQTADMLDLPVPKIRDGKPITVAVEPSPELREYVQKLVKRAEDIHNGRVKPDVDNMLCVTSDGRNAALDMRCINPALPDFPGSKVNACVRNVFDIYKETEAQKSAQMIFSDISTPKGGAAFSVYDDIKEKLIGMGVKPAEIAYIHDAKTDEQKEKMFAAVRRGEIRIILGSTQKMGAGTNAQKRLIALHHLDCPYRPSDLEQRDGRIVRQGNDNPEVRLYQYVTKNSFDAYLWQIIESKARAIAQVMSGKNPSREIEDMDEVVLNYAEVKAVATGNPMIKRKMELELEVQRLQILEAQYRADRYSTENAVLKHIPAKLAKLAEEIKGYEADIDRKDAHGGEFAMTLGKRQFTERKDAGEVLLKAVMSGQYADRVIGYYRGFEIVPPERKSLTADPYILLKGTLTHKIELSDSEIGSIARIENALERLAVCRDDNTREAEELRRRLEASKVRLTRPFEQDRELQDTLSELSKVNAELDIDRGADDGALPDDTAQEENEDVLGPDEEEAEPEWGDEDEPEI